jgi:uncharacterized protein YkwD
MRNGGVSRAAAIAFVCLALFGQGCSTPAIEPALLEDGRVRFSAQSALAEINAFRRANGVKPLSLDQRLLRAAATQSAYQARRGAIGHRGEGGAKVVERTQQMGYRPTVAGENVASGQKSFSEALRGWQKSAPHRRNLLLPDADAAGIAVSYRDGRAYYTLVVGAER